MSQLIRWTVRAESAMRGDTLHGHMAVFGQRAQVERGEWERITARAFDDVLKDPATDVVGLINHDPDQLLGRQSAGTMRLGVDSRGLAFEIDLPNTSYARDLRELVDRGDMTGASFAFIPDTSQTTYTRDDDGATVTEHNRVAKLRDGGPVTFPAYEGAGVALRSSDGAPIVRPNGRDQLIRARARVHSGRGANT